MATETFHLKTGDLKPSLQLTCLDGNDAAVALDEIGSVRFHMAFRDGDDNIIDAEAVVVDGPNGIVKYDWQDGDTDIAGTYRAEFEVISAGKPTTFPNDGFVIVSIRKNLTQETGS